MRRPRRVGALVVEADALVRVIDDRLNPPPAFRRGAEQRPRRLRELVGIAVARAQQVDHHVIGQVLHRDLPGLRHDEVGLSGVLDGEVRRDEQLPRRRDDAVADVVERIPVFVCGERRIEGDRLWAQEIGQPAGMDAQHQDYRGRLRQREADVETCPDLHRGHLVVSPFARDRHARSYWVRELNAPEAAANLEMCVSSPRRRAARSRRPRPACRDRRSPVRRRSRAGGPPVPGRG
jgi:hypothetical protein